MSTPRVALLGFAAGASLALGWMTVIAVRAVYSITAGHRWYQLKKL